MKLTVHLVTWNGAKYIPHLFASLRAQTNLDWELVVFDNASSDGTVAVLEHELATWSGPYRLIKNASNLGFAGGHNVLYAQTKQEYFLLLNQDFYLEPDCIEKLLAEITTKPAVAVVAPRLMKWDFAAQKFTTTIDSLGLRVFRNRRVVEIGAGTAWSERTEKILPVFGVSGAAPLFRRSAIEQVAFSAQEFFDALYGSYKEDVDLSYRLQSAGFAAETVLDAVIYHDRTAAGATELSDTAAAANKQTQSNWVQYQSYKNHLMTLYKNEYWQNFLLDGGPIIWYEFKKFIWLLFFHPSVLKGWKDIWQHRRVLQEKHKKNKIMRICNWQEMRKWWN